MGLPLVAVATNLAHDGLCSPVATLDNDAGRGSYGVPNPIAVVIDLDVIREAPARFVRSGIGDAMSNISAVADWELASEVNGEKVDGLAAAMARQAGEAVLRHPGGVGDNAFLQVLAEALVLTGIAMSVSGDSRPSSGACHEINHAFDLLYPKRAASHGEQCGLGAAFAMYLRGAAEEAAYMAEVLRRHGLPVLPEEIGFTTDEFVRVVEYARRPDPVATRSWNTSTSRTTRSRTRTRTMSRPSVAELRPVVHPEGVKDRRSGEHWAGRLYMREVSLRVDPYLVDTRITPNQLTYLMVVAGGLAGAALLVPGLTGAILGAVLIQLYLLLDCVDGEIARWRNQTSITGVYLDRIGHYLSESALLIGFGLRGADLWDGSGSPEWLWAFLGTLAALGAILIKAETDLVDVARSRSGLEAAKEELSVPRSEGLALARKAAAALKFHRLIGGVEASLFILFVAILDAFGGDLFWTRLGIAVLAGIAILQTVLHLVSILASSRLR